MAILEKELINRVRPHFQNKYMVFEEVALFNRSIDMVLLRKAALITIEFKINDWRRAVQQIKGHLIAADYGYLCMPKRKVSEKLQSLLNKNGIGLLLLDTTSNTLKEYIKPQKSIMQIDFYKKSLVERLSEREIR